MSETNGSPAPTMAERLQPTIPDAAPAHTSDGIENVIVPRQRWLEAAEAVRERGFIRFIDLTVVDDPQAELRFEVHLLLYSMSEQRWLRLKTLTDGALASVVAVFAGANMYEREAYDLFGVTFEGHPKLTRIMMPDGWQGHPLRRDEALKIEPVDFTVTRDLYKT